MKIVIARHGEAEAVADSDAKRPLTAYGREQARKAGQCLNELGMRFDALWVSPYRRAQQTAEGMRAQLTDMPAYTVELLTPNNNPDEVIAAIEAASHLDSLLIVSHQPLVSALIGRLTSASPYQGPPMATASLAMLEAETVLAGCCDLVWLRHAPNFFAE